MKHFDRSKWLDYKDSKLSEEEMIEMEDHLYTCDSCMQVFLSTIEYEEIKEAEIHISEEFTQNVMTSIKKIKPFKKVAKRKKKAVINDFFLYYAAVASVAIILTAGGFFGNMVDSIPKISININKEESKLRADTLFNFSETITAKTSDFINNFGTRKIKED